MYLIKVLIILCLHARVIALEPSRSALYKEEEEEEISNRCIHKLCQNQRIRNKLGTCSGVISLSLTLKLY